MTIGMLLAILSRPGGTGIKVLDMDEEDAMFDTMVSEFSSDKPDHYAVGVVKEGYEWVEHPVGSEIWFTRPASGGIWTKYNG